jgi:2-polyprenyl-3-methyl-5-hydroxy-6-metoxy-1,4-benzoquinol methylase
MTDRIHGKPIDVATFKKPVLSDVPGHLNKMRSIIDYLRANETSIEQNTCYICGGSDRTPLMEVHGFTYMTCSGCQHVYTSRRYSDEAIRRFYATNVYWAETTYANKETCHYRRQNVALPKVEFAMQYAQRPGGMWIDIGAGIGDLISVAQEKGFTGVGLELSETSNAFAKEVFGVDLVPQTMEEYVAAHPDIVGRVAAVSTIGLLEHVVAPLDVLKATHHVLAPGGIMMIQVPNANSMASMVQACFPENVFRHMSPIEHIMVFTEP